MVYKSANTMNNENMCHFDEYNARVAQYIIAFKHESDGVQLNRIVQNISLEIWYKHARKRFKREKMKKKELSISRLKKDAVQTKWEQAIIQMRRNALKRRNHDCRLSWTDLKRLHGTNW